MFRWDQVWYYLFQDPNFTFLQAAWITLWISVVAQAIGVVLGLILALMRTAKFSPFRWIAGAYTWFFRGSPLLVQVLLLWTGLPKVIPMALLPQWACVLIAFSLNEGAYMSEIIRAALGSVDSGQMEAAKALGMPYGLAMRRIIIPQAMRVIIPPLGNEFNNMMKTTSIASVIGLMELAGTAQVYGAQIFITFELLIVATVYYLLLTTIWEFIQRWIERRFDPGRTNVAVDEVMQKSFSQRVAGFGG
ncbi:amino acid ABC transporter permease [Dictyobacter arantiisoli]|uniref:Polar amino acid ABC transporter permease n=1 Tax=Dictyobacter arantiisoli TaxID=2014874 RepID=A0A5A5T8X4_9CHLR|nr:amino acid ABC transporter permease [Dictyobacter arantiisoli]GCF07439.1 polar amino acid ABC transporter permease [Dictyobacter arantiisoli]